MNVLCLEELYKELQNYSPETSLGTQIKLTQACQAYGDDTVKLCLELIKCLNEYEGGYDA